MTDMTTPKTPAATAQAMLPKGASAASTTANKSALVTLDQLAIEMKISPRDARMLLRLAAKQTKEYPNLGKEHVARQPCQWTPVSMSLDEARKALTPIE
jgi:hypothetical protein